jgi:hypothetical protein
MLARFLSSKEAEGFFGAVIVAQGDDVLIRKEYGAATRDGKPITATAVLKLTEDTYSTLTLHSPSIGQKHQRR